MTTPPPNPFDAALRDVLGAVLDGVGAPVDDVLDLDLEVLAGVDSLAALELVLVLEEHLGIELDLRAARRAGTLRQVVHGALADRATRAP